MKLQIVIISMVHLAIGSNAICPCPKNFVPVCGSDGKTYGNKCIFDCAAKKDTDLRIKCDTACNDNCPRVACRCANIIEPICGSDDRTYPNRCQFGCDAANNKYLTLRYDKACANDDQISESECDCEQKNVPVCGSDGITYGSQCLFVCAAKKDTSLSLYSGKSCEESYPPCPCPFYPEPQPVCGSNGKTYSSPCAFSCAARHFNLILKCESVCDQCPTDEVSCICSDIVAPVCGSDGKTYFNECELNCAAKINSGLILRCSQECTKCPTSTCRCTNVSDPVCGSNDVTYGNSCYLGCLNDPNVSMEHQGRCNKCN